MPTALVTGANRGIGLEFVRQFAAKGWAVHACCRRPDAAEALRQLAAAACGAVAVQQLDATDPSSLSALKEELAGQPLDLLVNNAGILDTKPVAFSESSRTTLQALGGIDYEAWSEVLSVNTIAPLRVSEALLPNIEASAQRKIVMISSVMGSITANDPDRFPPGGGIYAYRSSKAALNMVARTLAADLKNRGIVVLALNPGWVKTDMGGGDGMLAVEASVAGMVGLIEAAKPPDTGTFMSHDGNVLPW